MRSPRPLARVGNCARTRRTTPPPTRALSVQGLSNSSSGACAPVRYLTATSETPNSAPADDPEQQRFGAVLDMRCADTATRIAPSAKIEHSTLISAASEGSAGRRALLPETPIIANPTAVIETPTHCRHCRRNPKNRSASREPPGAEQVDSAPEGMSRPHRRSGDRSPCLEEERRVRAQSGHDRQHQTEEHVSPYRFNEPIFQRSAQQALAPRSSGRDPGLRAATNGGRRLSLATQRSALPRETSRARTTEPDRPPLPGA